MKILFITTFLFLNGTSYSQGQPVNPSEKENKDQSQNAKEKPAVPHPDVDGLVQALQSNIIHLNPKLYVSAKFSNEDNSLIISFYSGTESTKNVTIYLSHLSQEPVLAWNGSSLEIIACKGDAWADDNGTKTNKSIYTFKFDTNTDKVLEKAQAVVEALGKLIWYAGGCP